MTLIVTIKTSPKGFPASKTNVKNWICIFKILVIIWLFLNFFVMFWHFWGIFGEFFGDFFLVIFWEFFWNMEGIDLFDKLIALKKCPQEFVKSDHKSSTILSTKVLLLCPLEVCHPFYWDA